MSENESFTITDLMKKIIIISKNVKALSELVKTIDEKLNTKPADNKSKEDMDEIFKKNQSDVLQVRLKISRNNIWICLTKTRLSPQNQKLLNIINCLRTKKENTN